MKLRFKITDLPDSERFKTIKIIAEFFRISFYFSIYLCLLVPRILFNMDESNKRICVRGVLLCSVIYMTINKCLQKI